MKDERVAASQILPGPEVKQVEDKKAIIEIARQAVTLSSHPSLFSDVHVDVSSTPQKFAATRKVCPSFKRRASKTTGI